QESFPVENSLTNQDVDTAIKLAHMLKLVDLEKQCIATLESYLEKSCEKDKTSDATSSFIENYKKASTTIEKRTVFREPVYRDYLPRTNGINHFSNPPKSNAGLSKILTRLQQILEFRNTTEEKFGIENILVDGHTMTTSCKPYSPTI
ncbi:unnamed protein product, partial [marine sediment metagenome]